MHYVCLGCDRRCRFVYAAWGGSMPKVLAWVIRSSQLDRFSAGPDRSGRE